MARSADEKRQVLRQLRALLASGASEFEQLDALQLMHVSKRELRGLRNEILSSEVEELRSATVEETFLRYKFQMQGCIRDLDVIFKKADSVASPSPGILSAAVAAIKARSQIIEQMIDRGQSLDLIHKAPKRTMVIGGVVIADASLKEVKKLVGVKIAQFENLAQQTMLTSYVDEPDEPLYYDADDVQSKPTAQVIDLPIIEESPPKRRKVIVE